MSEANLTRFMKEHISSHTQIAKELQSAKTLDEFANIMCKYGKKHGFDFTADQVKADIPRPAIKKFLIRCTQATVSLKFLDMKPHFHRITHISKLHFSQTGKRSFSGAYLDW